MRYLLTVECSDGELRVIFPPELLESTGWKDGDELVAMLVGERTAVLRRDGPTAAPREVERPETGPPRE